MTAPRRARLGVTAAHAGTAEERRDPAHARGQAFCELLEHDAMPLCWFHHRRVHDPEYEHDISPLGVVTFRLRR